LLHDAEPIATTVTVDWEMRRGRQFRNGDSAAVLSRPARPQRSIDAMEEKDTSAGGSSSRTVIVVPCFNEADRLDEREIRRLSRSVVVWLADDGSTDGTADVIGDLAASSDGRIRAVSNDRNRGKAETVRRHVLAACDSGTECVGFLDADLATPVDEMLRLVTELEATGAMVVTGARVGLSGRDIRRTAARHYAGRIFSTVASLAMGTPYYDTQCGAKVFRVTPALRRALSEPFLSRWAFDVELLGRLLVGAPGIDAVPASALVESPLFVWHDVAGSKLTPLDSWKTGLELFRIWLDLRRRRRTA
jgi:dolichyl-phosphate beta-glucosyltransferase